MRLYFIALAASPLLSLPLDRDLLRGHCMTVKYCANTLIASLVMRIVLKNGLLVAEAPQPCKACHSTLPVGEISKRILVNL